MINSAAETTARAQVTASAFRMSADPARLGAFLEVLGLSPAVSNDAETWLELKAASGSVSVHAVAAAADPTAVAGSTDLVLVTPDVTTLADDLDRSADLDVAVWDEAFGRQAVLTLGGRRIMINEEQRDDYGYRIQEARPGPVTVAVHCYTDDVEALRAVLGLVGFHEQQSAPGPIVRLAPASRTGGLIYLHPEAAGDRYRLGLETEEHVDQLVDRLRRNSIDPVFVGAGQLEVRDPDGQPVTITAAP